MTKTASTSLANILFPNEEQDESLDSILQVEPEQRRLITETYDFTVSTLLDSFKKGSIYIPNYQRSYVWTDAQASRLIESLIIQCPIPVIYLSQEKDERLAVIDGNQRINSLNRFMENQFELTGLTAYPELEGNRFYELDSRFQRHISNRTLRCLAILKETHPQVKFDVFERLNTGSAKLSFQELRHAMYYSPFIELVEKLSKNSFLKSAAKVHAKRMKHEELVIRYFALATSVEQYQKPMSIFLNVFCDKAKKLSQGELENLKSDFESTMNFVAEWFGDNAFKIIYNDTIVSRFNAAIFDAVTVAASRCKNMNLRMPKNPHAEFMALLESKDGFKKSISQATSDETQVHIRIEEAVSFFVRYKK